MDSFALHSLNLRSLSLRFSSSKHCYFGKSSVSIKEVAVQPSHFVFQKEASPITNSSIRSDGDKVGQSSRKKETKRPQFFKGNNKNSNSSDQEEIIALFKRIQSSISKGDLQNTSKRSSKVDKDKPLTESILDILGEPKKQVKAVKNSNKAKGKDLTSIKGESRKEQETQEHQHVLDFKLNRPPSNFIKKSPIPFLSTPRGKVIEKTNEALPAIIVEEKQVQSERLEELKLAELKLLAKSRGVKGYSKLKKSELLQILSS